MGLNQREDFIWLAGLLEGEGYFAARSYHGGRPQLRVVLQMTDRDVVERAAAIVPTRVHDQGIPVRGTKPRFVVHWTGTDAETVMCQVLPFMGTRRSGVIEECLAQDLSHHPKRLKSHCAKGHPWDGANTYVRKGGGRICKACRRESMLRLARSRGIQPRH